MRHFSFSGNHKQPDKYKVPLRVSETRISQNELLCRELCAIPPISFHLLALKGSHQRSRRAHAQRRRIVRNRDSSVENAA